MSRIEYILTANNTEHIFSYWWKLEILYKTGLKFSASAAQYPAINTGYGRAHPDTRARIQRGGESRDYWGTWGWRTHGPVLVPPVHATVIFLIFCSTYGIIESKSKLVILYKFLWSSGKGQARIGKGWQSRQKASKLKPLPRAYTKVGCHPPPTTHHP